MDQELTVASTSDDTPPLTQIKIDQRVFALYDEYCHGRMDRRVFLAKSAAVTAGGLVMAQALLPRYARAQTISFTDPRIKARYVSYPSRGGTSGTMRSNFVQPAGNGPFPTVLVIHENRRLNPYIEDVARRAATEGFLALAPDGLSPVVGTDVATLYERPIPEQKGGIPIRIPTVVATPACDALWPGQRSHIPNVANAGQLIATVGRSPPVFGLAIRYETSALRRLSTP